MSCNFLAFYKLGMSDMWNSQYTVLSSDVKLVDIFIQTMFNCPDIFMYTVKRTPEEGWPTFGVSQIESDISFVCFVGLHMKYLFVVHYFRSLYRLIQI